MGKPTGSMAQTGGGGAGGKSATSGFENFLANGINQGVFGGGNFGNAINTMLQGQVGDPNSLNGYFQNMQNGNGMVQGVPQLGNTFNAPQFQGFTAQNPGVASANYTAPQWQSQQFQGIDPNSGINSNTLNSGFGTTAQLGNAGSANVDGEFGQAVRSILGREQDKSIADMRARYGANGSGLGSNAQFAESNFRAEALPQVAAALGNINQQERGLNLTQRAQDLQNFYQGRGADISQLGVMGQQGANANNAILGMNQLFANQNNAMNQFNQGNAQFGTQAGLQAQGMNMDAINQMNQLMQNQNQFQNSFNANNSQFGAQFGQQADMANIANLFQNQQMGNQFAGQQAQTGLGLQGNQLQAQQGAMQAFMQMMMQNQGLNTAQAQNYYKPGWLEQGMGLASQAAGIASKFMNPLGGMAGSMMQGLGGMGGGPQVGMTPMNTNGAFQGYPNMMPNINIAPLPLPGIR